MANAAFARFFAISVTLISGTRVSRAAESEDSDALIHKGIELRKAGADLSAEGYLRRAYELTHTRRAEAQFGLVEYALRHYAVAEPLLSEALTGPDPWIDLHRDVLEKSRGEVRSHLGRVVVNNSPLGGTLTLGASLPRLLVADLEAWVDPGTPPFVVRSKDGQEMSGRIVVSTEVTTTIDYLPDVPREPHNRRPFLTSIPSRPSSNRVSPVPFVVSGIGLAIEISGALLYRMAGSKLSNIAGEAKAGARYDEGNGDWSTLNTLGTTFMIAGAVTIAAGAVVLISTTRHHDEPTPSRADLPGLPGLVF